MTDPIDLARPDPGASTSEQLRDLQAALAASQADLTRVEAERDELRSEVERLVDLGSKALREREEARAEAERHLTALDMTVRALAAANYRLLTRPEEGS